MRGIQVGGVRLQWDMCLRMGLGGKALRGCNGWEARQGDCKAKSIALIMNTALWSSELGRSIYLIACWKTCIVENGRHHIESIRLVVPSRHSYTYCVFRPIFELVSADKRHPSHSPSNFSN